MCLAQMTKVIIKLHTTPYTTFSILYKAKRRSYFLCSSSASCVSNLLFFFVSRVHFIVGISKKIVRDWLFSSILTFHPCVMYRIYLLYVRLDTGNFFSLHSNSKQCERSRKRKEKILKIKSLFVHNKGKAAYI